MRGTNWGRDIDLVEYGVIQLFHLLYNISMGISFHACFILFFIMGQCIVCMVHLIFASMSQRKLNFYFILFCLFICLFIYLFIYLFICLFFVFSWKCHNVWSYRKHIKSDCKCLVAFKHWNRFMHLKYSSKWTISCPYQ